MRHLCRLVASARILYMLAMILPTFTIPLHGQAVAPADSLIITTFLSDLEALGGPPVVHTSRPMAEWYGLTLVTNANDEVTELNFTVDPVFQNVLCPQLPASVGNLNQLPALATLRLVNLGIAQLPEAIGNLDQLITLDLRHNHLAALPGTFTDMHALQNIYLDYNDFTTIDPAILAFDALKGIYLSYNQITTFSDALWPTGTNNNVTIDLSHNEMSGAIAMPPDYSLIKKFDVSYNHFFLNDLSELNTQWPYDAYGHRYALSKGGQVVGGYTVAPAEGEAVTLSVKNYPYPGESVWYWYKVNPLTEQYEPVTDDVSYSISAFDPDIHAGTYQALLMKSMSEVIFYGPVEVEKPTPVAPTLMVSPSSIVLRPNRAAPSITVSYQDDITTINNLVLSIDDLPEHVEITSSQPAKGTYQLSFEIKDPTWRGQEDIAIRVTDGDGLTTTETIHFAVEVQPNDPPLLHTIPDVVAYTDSVDLSPYEYVSYASIPMQLYIEDDYDTVTAMTITIDPVDVARFKTDYNLWLIASSEGASVFVAVEDYVETLPVFHETVRYTVTDVDGASSEGTIPIRFVSQPYNFTPVVDPIPDQYVLQGTVTPLVIDLDDYIHDDYNAPEDLWLSQMVEDTPNFSVTVAGHIITLTPHADAALDVFDEFPLVISEPNSLMTTPVLLRAKIQSISAPLISPIDDYTVYAPDEFPPIPISVYDAQTPADEMLWSFSGHTHLQPNVADGILSLTLLDTDWRGSETISFTATDGEGLTHTVAATFSVFNPNNKPPVITIENQYVSSPAAFESINLLDAVTDDYTAPEDIVWNISNGYAEVVTVERIGYTVNITPIDPNWRGKFTIRFQATDVDGRYDIAYAQFAYNYQPPVVAEIPPVTAPLGTSYMYLDFNDYVSDDVDDVYDLKFEILSNPTHLTGAAIHYVSLGDIVYIEAFPVPGWVGEESVPVRVTDKDGLIVDFSVTFKVYEDGYTLSGVVRQEDGNPLPNVRLEGVNPVVTTDASGAYTTTQAAGSNITLTPVLAGYTFQPATYTVTNLDENLTVDFAATAVAETPVTIQGTVLDDAGNPLAGVGLQGFTAEVTTDVNGHYETSEAMHWAGTITPVKPNYTFTPATHTFTDLTTDTSADFQGNIITYFIAGVVKDAAGTPIPNVSITGETTTLTDDAGGYSIQTSAGWTGTLVALLDGYTFAPEEITITNLQTDQVTHNFTGTVVTGIEPVWQVRAAYPNPSAGQFTLPLPALAEWVQVYTSNGVMIWEQSLTQLEDEMVVTLHTPGTYVVKILQGKEMYAQKVTIH